MKIKIIGLCFILLVLFFGSKVWSAPKPPVGAVTVTASFLPTPPDCANGTIDQKVPYGTTVAICWDVPNAPTNLTFFRIRRTQNSAPSGAYAVWGPKLTADQRYIEITADGNYQYFLTAWYTFPLPDGTTRTVESVGSNHVRITIK
jgi:hypothetical protein